MTQSPPDSAAATFLPPHALTLWADRDRIYVAYPSASGAAPMIVPYPRNTIGLTAVLAAMVKAYETAHPLPRAPQPAAPTVRAPVGTRKDPRRTSGARPAPVSVSDSERQGALEALVEAGILSPAKVGH